VGCAGAMLSVIYHLLKLILQSFWPGQGYHWQHTYQDTVWPACESLCIYRVVSRINIIIILICFFPVSLGIKDLCGRVLKVAVFAIIRPGGFVPIDGRWTFAV